METISEEVRYVFTIPHLQYVWPQLRRLGLDTELVAKDFWESCEFHANRKSHSDYFLKYGIEKIQPMMNVVLNRSPDHPTFVRMIEYVMKDFVAKSAGLRKVTEQE